MRIADEAERRTGRKVAWGARCGDERRIFTSLSVPVMTRLRMSERQVLDTLVGAGVARSRSDALAWCVRLVRDHEGEWIGQLQDALVAVREARVRPARRRRPDPSQPTDRSERVGRGIPPRARRSGYLHPTAGTPTDTPATGERARKRQVKFGEFGGVDGDARIGILTAHVRGVARRVPRRPRFDAV